MISKERAIQIAKNAMPHTNFKIEKAVLQNKVWYVGLKDLNNDRGFQVEIDAETGKIIGGGGGK